MSEKHVVSRSDEIPLDFTQYLSRRLGLETQTTLSMLGSFLLSFEPKTSGSASSGAQSPAPYVSFSTT